MSARGPTEGGVLLGKVLLVVAAAGAVALLLALAGATGGFGTAPERGPVPGVVGMTVPEAHLELGRAGYGCAVVAEGDGGSEQRLVAAQRERPGSYHPRGNLVRITVSEPYPEDARYPRDPRAGLLPPNCIDLRGGHGRTR